MGVPPAPTLTFLKGLPKAASSKELPRQLTLGSTSRAASYYLLLLPCGLGGSLFPRAAWGHWPLTSQLGPAPC